MSNNKQPVAVCTGITGQDGSYLAEFLLEKGYKVVGIRRRTSTFNTERLEPFYEHPNFVMEWGNITDSYSLYRIINKYQPDEIYNLAAMSHVKVSFDVPEEVLDTVAKGTLHLLNIIKEQAPQARFYQAGSSEQFGVAPCPPTGYTEESRMEPASPYAAAKVYAYNLVKNYRAAYGLHLSTGLLHNHESPRRGETFVTRKITQAAARIKLGKQDKLYLGNLEAKRDWGHARDYCINKDVPILTPCGWKTFDQISPGDEVINFNAETNSLSRDNVLKVVEPQIESDRKIRLKGRSIDLVCTPNHRVYYQQKSKTSKGGWSKWKVASAQEIKNKFDNLSTRTKYDYRFPHFQNYQSDDTFDVTDDQIYLVGALLAEGCLITSHKQGRGHSVSISQSHIANPKIHAKIETILNRFKFDYRTRINNSGVTEWMLKTESTEEILSWFDSNDIHVMPTWCYQLSARQAQILFDAMMDCDGHWGSMTYCSKRSLLAFDFQTIAALAGYQTTKPKIDKANCWRVTSIVKRHKYSYVTEASEFNDGKTDVWCVSTNNGTIISRDNGSISISGNCEAMWLMLQQDTPDDYVIATGETHSVQEFLDVVFDHAGLSVKDHVEQAERYLRPQEVPYLLGDASKAKRVLGWQPKTTFEELAIEMYESDLREAIS